ncbi:DegT/DnrJ/EryC1/StrS family aminotransferase [bacterium]
MIYLSCPDITDKEKRAVLEVLDSGMLASGPKVREFEERFAEYTDTSHAVCVSNGTTALHVSLLASGIKRDDKVLTTPFSFIATSNSILFCNAQPLFADINPITFNLDPNKVEDILKKEQNIKAIILVHLYGFPCEMDAFSYLAEKYNVKIIEDSAQAVGAEYNNRKAGSFGIAGTFSFYATKNMMTGEGGMITSSDESFVQKVRSLINHGRSGRFLHSELGYNFRMTDIQAALGIVQLSRLEEFITKRQQNADFYDKNLADLDWIKLPVTYLGHKHVYHQYTVRVKSEIRDAFVKYMNDKGVNVAPIYPISITQQPFYKAMDSFDCPQAVKISSQVVCLPVHTKLSQDDLEKIVKIIKGFKK